MIFPQTKPTSANEANLENLMKTMFELNNTMLGCSAERTCDIAQALWPSEPERSSSQHFSQTKPVQPGPSWLRLRHAVTGAGRGLLQ
jgi:hypothetical protein